MSVEFRADNAAIPNADGGSENGVSEGDMQRYFVDAAEDGDLEEVKRLVEEESTIDVNAVDSEGRIALVTACLRGQADVAVYLADLPNVDLNCLDDNRDTPLCAAVYGRDLSILRHLMTKPNIRINANTDMVWGTALNIVCAEGNVEAINCMTAHPRINLNRGIRGSGTPLHMAARWDHRLAVEALLSKSTIQVNAQDVDGATPLHCACKEGHLSTVNSLLRDKRVNTYVENRKGKTVLEVGKTDEVKNAVYYARFFHMARNIDKVLERPIYYPPSQASVGYRTDIPRDLVEKTFQVFSNWIKNALKKSTTVNLEFDPNNR